METTTKNRLSPELIKQLEQVESSYWMRYYQTPASIASHAALLHGGFAGATPKLDILAMNRTIGIGVTRPIDDQVLDDVIRFYELAGSRRFFLQLPPQRVDERVRSTLERRGFTHYNNWSKLFKTEGHPDFPTNAQLKIRKINSSEAIRYGEIIFSSFDWEDKRLVNWLASTVGQSGYHHYLVEYQGQSIAAGALFVEGDMASMAFAGTLVPYRGLGAQSLLLKTRMKEAFQLGAQFITAETAESSAHRPVKSFENLTKVGFEIAYQRQNWIYHC